jgi:hypothetical protein
MDQQSVIDRGAKAERLLNDPLLQEAFDLVRVHFLSMFENAPLRDDDGIVKARYLLHSLGLVRGALEQAVRDGKIELQTLEDKKRGVSWLGDVWQQRKKR